MRQSWLLSLSLLLIIHVTAEECTLIPEFSSLIDRSLRPFKDGIAR